MVGSDKRDRGADLLGGGTAAKWQRLEQFLPVILAAGAITCLFLHERNKAVGRDRARIDGHDADAIAVLTPTEDRFCDPPGVCIDLTITKSRWGESNIKIPLIARLDLGAFTEVAAEQQGW